jgi:hypothetical protein
VAVAPSINLSNIRPQHWLQPRRGYLWRLAANSSNLQGPFPLRAHRSSQLLESSHTFILKGRKATFWDFSRASNSLPTLSSSSWKWFPLLAYRLRRFESLFPGYGRYKGLFSSPYFSERKSPCLIKTIPRHMNTWGGGSRNESLSQLPLQPL